MHRRKSTQLTRVSLAIIIFSVMVVFPLGNSMTIDVSLDSQTNKTNEQTYSEDTFNTFNDTPSKSTIPVMDSDHFTQNMGQWEDHIKFLAQTSFGYAAFGDDGIYYYLVLGGEGHTIKLTFENAIMSFPFGLDDCGFESNYFYGNDKSKWVRETKSFEKVKYEDVWPGIDLIYFFTEGYLKYDVVVDEYAKTDLIAFHIEGHTSYEIGEDKLVISISEDFLITDSNLIAYYEDDSTETVQFKKITDSTYGFDVDKKDGKKLIIDPIVFSSSTFLGGSNSDRAKDMDFDSNGNIIILGETNSYDFPNTTGAFQTESAGTIDMVITKMDPNGTYLIFSTYIGGWHCDFPYALDVDQNDDVYATGETWARDFPTTPGSYMEDAPPGNQDVFVLKLSSSGSDLIYSTYVGNSSADWGRDIKVFNGFAYVVGHTYDYFFPYVSHPVDNAHGTIFFLIMNLDGSNLTHTDFWGGHQNEVAYSLKIAPNGDAVVGGITNSNDFPITLGVYQENATDNNNGFLLKYRPSTHTLLFSTYIGGSALDEIRSIYLEGSGDIYFSGITNNPVYSGQIPFPTTTGAYDRTYNGSKDAFIGKMSGDLTTLIYSTLYGSEGEEMVGSIDVDNQGNVYFIGNLNSDVNFTVTPDAFDCTFNQGDDVVFAVLNADGSDVLYSTYLGGNASDLGETCLLSRTDEIFLFGTTVSMDFPSTNGSYQTENNGSGVLFITKFIIGDFLFLHEGWNMISIPLVPTDANLNIVLSSIKGYYDAVQWFDSTDTLDNWKHYHTKKPSHFNDLAYIDHSRGFWIHITEPGGVLFRYSGDPPMFPKIISLKKGWNAVGYPASANMRRDLALNTLTYDVEVNSIWYHDALNKTWHKMGPTDYFVRGKGYYIHATQDCEWWVP